MILVVCAVGEELRHWKPRPHVEMLVTGIGPVEAAVATARALVISPPRAVVNAGIAGGFRGRIDVGGALAVASDTLAELGLEDATPMPPLPGGAALATRAESDARLLDAAARAGAPIGNAVTVATVTCTRPRAERLARRYDADVEAMEGFAVLRAAALAGIPALELRGVSNIAGPRAQGGWDFNAGARAVAALLDRVLDQLA